MQRLAPRSLCLDRCFSLQTDNPLCRFTLICDFIREGNGSKYKKPLSFFREGDHNASLRCCVTILSVIFITHLGLGLLVSIMPRRAREEECMPVKYTLSQLELCSLISQGMSTNIPLFSKMYVSKLSIVSTITSHMQAGKASFRKNRAWIINK